MANNEDSLAVESSDNVSEQEGKILEISGETKFFIKNEEEMVGGNENRNLPKSSEISTPKSTEISEEIYQSLYKKGYVRPSTLITEVSDSSNDDEVDEENSDCENCKKSTEMAALASKVEDMMIPEDKKDDVDDKSKQE